jgi:hypothetical protein
MVDIQETPLVTSGGSLGLGVQGPLPEFKISLANYYYFFIFFQGSFLNMLSLL